MHIFHLRLWTQSQSIFQFKNAFHNFETNNVTSGIKKNNNNANFALNSFQLLSMDIIDPYGKI